MFDSKSSIFSYVLVVLIALANGNLHAANDSHRNPALEIPKELVFSLIIPELSTETSINLSLTCSYFNKILFSDQNDKIALYSSAAPLTKNIRVKALVFCARKYSAAVNAQEKENWDDLSHALLNNTNQEEKQKIIDVLSFFGKNDSFAEFIDVYSRDYIKNKNLHLILPQLTGTDASYAIELLIEQDFDPNIINKNGETPLHQAALCNDLDSLIMLRDYSKTNHNFQDHNGFTALHRAMRARNNEAKDLIINSFNIKPNVKDSKNRTVLYWAVAITNLSSVEKLLDYSDIDANIADAQGRTAVHLAINMGNDESLKALLDHAHINPNIIDKYGNSPLHLAIKKKQTGAISQLLKHSEIDPNAKNRRQHTPLHAAVLGTELKYVKMLLSHDKINPNIKDRHGNKPLTCALHKFSDEEQIKYIKAFLKNPQIKYGPLKSILFGLLKCNGDL